MKSLSKKILLASLLALGTQSFASMACEGTVYLKLPDEWKSAYAIAGGVAVKFTASAEYSGWLQVSVSDIGGINETNGFNINETSDLVCNETGHCITPLCMDSAYMMISDRTGFTCARFSKTGELWISANPDPAKPTTPYYSSNPPDVKYFYVFVPNTEEWLSAIPMLSVGGKPGEAMSADPERAGWYYKRFVDEELPTSVLIYRDDDEKMAEAIGMGGNWDAAASPTPINLKTIFETFESDKVYFVADEDFVDETSGNMGWTSVEPTGVEGVSYFNLAALIYDTDAALHGAFTCTPMWWMGQTETEALNNACYDASAPYNVVASATGVVPCIGVTQGMVESVLTTDANGKKKMTLTAAGKKCFGSNADEAFATMFNYTEGVNENYCVELPFSRGLDGKWGFDSDYYMSSGAHVLGGFYPAEETPMDFVPGTEPLPAAEAKRMAEGPIYMCTDYYSLKSSTPEGLRTIDSAEGVPVSDLICNGPGWDRGIDCEGLFVGGGEFSSSGGTLTAVGKNIQSAFGVTFSGDGWSWSCTNEAPIGWNFYEDGTETRTGFVTRKGQLSDGTPRWTSGTDDAAILTKGGRNQHFCFESHATFRYKKGLRFSIRGDDDIWVYIDNQLAVDLGGTHLPAPGYVNLDKFVGKSGSWVVGELYPIDIYFCDRRTTMSNIAISTNAYLTQDSPKTTQKKATASSYTLQYCATGDGSSSCVSAAMGQGTGGNCLVGDDLCADLAKSGEKVQYRIETKDGTLVASEEELDQATTYFGGVDLSNRCDAKINNAAMIGLTPNTYILTATVRGKTQLFQFKVKASEDADSTNVKPNDDDKSDSTDVKKDDKKDDGKSDSTDVEKDDKKDDGKGDSTDVKKDDKKDDGKSDSTDVEKDDKKDDGKGDSTDVKKDDSKGDSTDVKKDDKKDDDKGEKDDDSDAVPPSFRVVLTGPFTFDIVFVDAEPGKTKSYAVMDLMGGIIKQGKTVGGTRISVKNSGSYIVRVGRGYQKVDIK